MTIAPRRPATHPQRDLRGIAVPGYRILEPIGSGSMSVVHRAVHIQLQREVALKVLSPALTARPGFAERFLSEARSAAAIQHPHVVACYDAGEHGGLLYQALELITGPTLEQRLIDHGGVLEPPAAIALMLDCARGLEGIHKAGLSHQDIKPANIYLTAEGVAKLGDLGLARTLGEAQAEGSDLVSPIDVATVAPEQILGHGPCDIRTDIYALGATLYVLVTGHAPRESGDDHADRDLLRLRDLFSRAITPDPRHLVPALPDTLASVIMRALAHQPEHRYQTPALLREDLERLSLDFAPLHALLLDQVEGDPAAITSSTRLLVDRALVEPAAADQPPAPTPAPARPLRWPLLAAGAAVLVALVGWFALAGRSPAPVPAPAAPAPVAALPPAVIPAAAPVAVPAEPVPAWASAAGRDEHGRWAEFTLGEVRQRLRWCPAGSFIQGSPVGETGHQAGESERSVTLSAPFWLAATETTQELWQQVMGANPSRHRGERMPVDSVSFDQVQEFLLRLNARSPALAMRLPSEAEWEYACRAGSQAPFSGGSDPARVAWTEATSGGGPHPVGQLQANAWGLYDLHGNLMEWCQDFFAPYDGGPVSDPLGWSGVQRVVRGGAWSTPAADARAAARHRYLPPTRMFFIGFRLARNG
jgi:sulfatase modifying factor 1